MSHNVLDSSALISALPQYLPQSKKTLQTPQDGLASLFHTIMGVLGFRLVAINDTSPPQSFQDNVLPDDWNANGPGNFTFRYRHDQSSLEFVLKVSKLGTRTMVHAIAVEVGNCCRILIVQCSNLMTS